MNRKHNLQLKSSVNSLLNGFKCNWKHYYIEEIFDKDFFVNIVQRIFEHYNSYKVRFNRALGEGSFNLVAEIIILTNDNIELIKALRLNVSEFDENIEPAITIPPTFQYITRIELFGPKYIITEKGISFDENMQIFLRKSLVNIR